MTTDRFAALRAAVESGPTRGPWAVSEDYPRPISILSESEHIAYVNCEDTHNARYIAAADPDTIRALLDERDEWMKQVAIGIQSEHRCWLRLSEVEAERNAWRQRAEEGEALLQRGLQLGLALQAPQPNEGN